MSAWVGRVPSLVHLFELDDNEDVDDDDDLNDDDLGELLREDEEDDDAVDDDDDDDDRTRKTSGSNPPAFCCMIKRSPERKVVNSGSDTAVMALATTLLLEIIRPDSNRATPPLRQCGYDAPRARSVHTAFVFRKPTPTLKPMFSMTISSLSCP